VSGDADFGGHLEIHTILRVAISVSISALGADSGFESPLGRALHPGRENGGMRNFWCRIPLIWFCISLGQGGSDADSEVTIEIFSPREDSHHPLAPNGVFGSLWLPNGHQSGGIFQAHLDGGRMDLVWNFSLETIFESSDGLTKEFMFLLPALDQGSHEIVFEVLDSSHAAISQRILLFTVCTPMVRILSPRCIRTGIGETLVGGEIDVDFEISGTCDPEMAAFGAASIVLDGAVVGRTTTQRYHLRGIREGTHEIQVILTDLEGRPAANASATFAASRPAVRAAALIYHAEPMAVYRRQWVDASIESVLAQTMRDFDVLELDYSGPAGEREGVGCVCGGVLGS
jgi:hypothetical protein